MSSFIAGTPSLLFLPARAEHSHAAAHNEDGQGSVPAGVSPVTRSLAGTDDGGSARCNPALNCDGAEEWRVIPCAPAYEASALGRVRRTEATARKPAGHVLSQSKDKTGRLRVRLCIDGKAKTYGVHHLVLGAFVGPRPSDYFCCCHWNDDPTDNRLSNLRWGSYVDNSADKARNGRQPNGAKHYKAKLSDAQVLLIREQVTAGRTPRELASWYGVATQTISKIAQRRTWRHV